MARNAITAAIEAYPSDDRNALALLLLPLLILAASLGISQTWRYTVARLPEIAMQAPIAISHPQPAAVTKAIAPPSNAPPVAAPTIAAPTVTAPPVAAPVDIAVPGTLRYPTAAPPISTASLDIVPSAPVIARPVPPPAVTEPQTDIAMWSPPRTGWQDRLTTPPTIDVLPISPPTAPVATAPAAPPADICRASPVQLASFALSGRMARPRQPLADSSDPAAFGLKLAAAARAQTQDLVIYNANYFHMAFPMGDMPSFYGACTDLIIRAYRAVGIDLQEQVLRTHSGRGDTNIDHRRTETLRVLFTRGGGSLPVTRFPEDYKPGDVVTYHRPFSRVSSSHIAMVSDVLAPSGRPMIVHNRGWGPQLEDALFVDRITGHYRYMGPGPATPAPAATVAANEVSTPARAVVKASFPGAALVARRQRHVADTGTAISGPAPKAH